LAQVVEFLEDSNEADIREFSVKNAGACRAVYIEKRVFSNVATFLMVHQSYFM